MNQSFVQAVPYNHEATEWADCNHFEGGRIACLKYAFNPKLGRYEWLQTGPLLGGEAYGVFEGSLVQFGNEWLLAARQQRAAGVASADGGSLCRNAATQAMRDTCQPHAAYGVCVRGRGSTTVYGRPNRVAE